VIDIVCGSSKSVTDGDVLQTTPPDLAEALRIVARHYDGPRGVWAYDVFDIINAVFFGGELPTPKIQWALTPHGGCLGLTRSSNLPPVVTLHPSLMGGTEKVNPWNVEPAWLGESYAFDTLLHEAIHVSQHYRLGGGIGPTSHNNSAWMTEVNRIAPLLGFDGVVAGQSKTRRVPIEGETSKTGRPATRVERFNDGNMPFKAIAKFPYGVRMHLGTADDHYRANVIPVTRDYVLQTTEARR
jgi:hypothetical protein